VLGFYIQNRGARAREREERSWQRKAEAYVDLVGVMHRMAIGLGIYDPGFLVRGDPITDAELPGELAARLRAYGSKEVHDLLTPFWDAGDEYRRAKDAGDAEAVQIAEDAYEQSITAVEAQVRHELNPDDADWRWSGEHHQI
jgi:hypothetical protein